jgi:transcriptional regulator with XRE-family HTH domain
MQNQKEPNSFTPFLIKSFRQLFMETVGERILKIRKQEGLSQEELSYLADINLRTLQRIEKCESEPQEKTLQRICEILEVNPEDLLDFGEKEDNKYIIYFHLSVLSFIFLPIGNIIFPGILWLTRKDKIIALNNQWVDLINFQILWSLLFSLSIITFAYMTSIHWHTRMVPKYIVAILFLTNIIYPIVISFLVSKSGLKQFYYPLIKFIRL